MGRILQSLANLGAKLLPQTDATLPAPSLNPYPHGMPPVCYSERATMADIVAAGIRGGMSAEEIEQRLARVMGPACALPPSS